MSGVDLVKLTKLHNALHSMIEWYYEVPFEVRKRWVLMPEFVQGLIDDYGPWIESAPDSRDCVEPALRAVGMDPDAELVDETILRLRVERIEAAWRASYRRADTAESRVRELEQALRELYASVQPYGISDGGLGPCSRYYHAAVRARALLHEGGTQ